MSPRLQAAMRSEQFAIAVGLAARVRRTFEEQASRTSRRVLHQLNLPAGTDVSRILSEMGQLRQQVRQLQAELDDTRAELAAERERPAARPKGSQTKAGRAKGDGDGAAPRSERARRSGTTRH